MVTFPWICAVQVWVALCSMEDAVPTDEGDPPVAHGDAPRGLFTPRWVELRQQYGIERPREMNSELYIHRLPRPQHGGTSTNPMSSWIRILATHDLWPDELIDDITFWYDDLRNQWPQVAWWVTRVHAASASSRMPLLQQVNYVLISDDDFRTYEERPHGLLEFGFEEPQLCTTVLPRFINWPILSAFLSPLWVGMQAGTTAWASLNGHALTHQLVECRSGFYLRVYWGGNAYLGEQLERMVNSHSLQLHLPQLTITGTHLRNRGVTVYLPGGSTLIMSRKLSVLGPNNERDIDFEIRRRFPDLAQETFGLGPVHSSYYMLEPVVQPGWTVQLVIPLLEDDETPVVLFKAVLPPYEGIGAIYVPSVTNKFDLIMNTGLDIVCGPQGELCACYHNGLVMSDAQSAVSDNDFFSCYLTDMGSVAGHTNAFVSTCSVGDSQRGSVILAGARS